MMNFRYHVVSLIAVFLALAIGVVLGAGPLQSRIARSVDAPAAQTAQGETAASRTLQVLSGAEAKGVRTLSQKLTTGALQGANVVTVALPGADPADVSSAREALTRAGATLSGQVSLTDNWDVHGMSQYREQLSLSLASRIPGIPKEATFEEVIGYALVNVLTTVGAERDIAFEILTDKDTPILKVEEDPKGGAHAIVVIGPRDTSNLVISSDQDAVVHATGAWTGLARAIATAPKGGVFVGDASSTNSMLTLIRSEAVPVTTIDQVGTETANLSLVIALGSAGPQQRAFGVGEGATAVFPPLPKLD